MPKPSGIDCEKECWSSAVIGGVVKEKNLQGIRPEVERLYALQEEKRAIEKEIDVLKQKINMIMGEAETGVCEEYTVNYVRQERKGIDQEKLRMGFPEAWKACQKTTCFRSLKISKEK